MMDKGTLMRENWNRMSELSKLPMNGLRRTELNCRIDIQNSFSCGKDEDETIKGLIEFNELVSQTKDRCYGKYFIAWRKKHKKQMDKVL